MPLQTEKKRPQYILGHSPEELERLIQQSSYYNEATRQAFTVAGLKPGMRVLDLGCGTGDVSMIAAEIVGASGKVLGIDQSSEAINLARYRVREAGLDQIRFLVEDITQFQADEPFDAIVGRLILLYQANPTETIKGILPSLKPGGIIVFQEFNVERAYSSPKVLAFDRGVDIIRETFIRANMDKVLGNKLFFHFQSAGLPLPKAIGYQNVVAGADFKAIQYMTNTVRSLLPFARQLGVVGEHEHIDFDQWQNDIAKEIVEKQSVLYTPLMISAFTQKRE